MKNTNSYQTRRGLFTLLSIVLIASACAHAEKKTEAAVPIAPAKKEIVFINGSHLDETSWFEVVRILGTEKYSALALPRLGRDEVGPSSLAKIAELSCAQLKAPSTLVVHSFGGAIANAMYGVCPEKFAGIVYVSALIPASGETPMALLKGVDQKTYMAAVKMEKGRIVPRSQKKLLQALDSGINPNTLILPKVYSESMAVNADVVQFDYVKMQSVPKFYIFTENDKVLPLSLQKKYVE
ncbi:MAG: alpha/beta hydrolase, partial [Proteobacteria bacterium]